MAAPLLLLQRQPSIPNNPLIRKVRGGIGAAIGAGSSRAASTATAATATIAVTAAIATVATAAATIATGDRRIIIVARRAASAPRVRKSGCQQAEHDTERS